MKKNFLKVAALLIAAMLLVVSCSQEVAPKNEDNRLVDAKLNIAYGRDLTVTGAQDAEEFILEYTTEYQWTKVANGYTEVVGQGEQTHIEGEQTDVVLSSDGKLGWLTPGFWKVTVKAYKKAGNAKTGNPIFEGSTSAYFTSKTSTATIFLEPVKASNNSISFEFYMQDLGKEYGTDFVVKYTISKNGSSLGADYTNIAFTEDQAKKVYKTDNGITTEAPAKNPVYDNQRCYTKTVNGLASGFYTVTVAVYEKDGSDMTLKGGITKGMLLAGNTATVGGHIEPSDYAIGTVSSYFIDVDTVLTATLGNYSDGKVTVTYTLTDKTDTTKYGKDLNVTRTYIWDFDGKPTNPAQDVNTPLDTKKQIKKTQDYSVPGVKNVSCTTIYYYEVSENEKYFWAETQNVQATVPTTGFAF